MNYAIIDLACLSVAIFTACHVNQGLFCMTIRYYVDYNLVTFVPPVIDFVLSPDPSTVITIYNFVK